MLYELTPSDYVKAQPLFTALDHHLAIRSLVASRSPGTIYADDPERPRSALARVGHRFHLAGAPGNEFAAALGRLFTETIYPQALSEGKAMFILFHAPEWEDQIDTILPGKQPIKGQRQYYTFDTSNSLPHDWRALLPPGFSLREVNEALLAQSHLKNLESLCEEMCSERPTVHHFLARSFGVCVVDEATQALAGWCLSEYNTGDRCEVGIETVEGYRRRGLATAMTCALVELARARDIAHVGWDCWTSNTPSSGTALKAGFTKQYDESIYFAWFNEADNLAVHGNVCFGNGQYAEALDWYGQAFARGNQWEWSFWNAAQAAVHEGRHDASLRYLLQAIDHGFTDIERIRASEHLKPLHGSAGWEALLARLAA
jgi:hypothetical protein